MTTLSTHVRAMLCAVFLLLWLGVYAQTDTYAYTIYYNTSSATDDVSKNCWGETDTNFLLYIQVYSGEGNNVTYYTSDTYVNGDSNWATCTWTGISYIFSYTLTTQEALPEGTQVKFTGSWNSSSVYGPFDFTGGTMYNGDGKSTMSISFSLKAYDYNDDTLLDELSEIKVQYPTGIYLNDSYSGSGITIKKSYWENITNIYLKAADRSEEDNINTLTFKLYSDASFTQETKLAGESSQAYYEFTFPSGYFLLGTGDSQTTNSSGESVAYMIKAATDAGGDGSGGSGVVVGEGSNEYTITYFSEYWANDDNVSVVIYYTDPNTGVTTYYLGSYDEYTQTENGQSFETGSNGTYTITFYTEEEIPAGAVCKFITCQSSGGTSYDLASADPLIYRDGETYVSNGFHYNDAIPYYDTYFGGWSHTGLDITGKTITHREAEWYKYTDSSHDTFNKTDSLVYTESGIALQAANVYVDTIYMYKGDSVTLTLPYVNGGGSSMQAYQRWYDYRTDGIYQYAELEDLLMPLAGSGEMFRFKNGYVAGRGLDPEWHSTTSSQMTFHYPTDSEYASLDSEYYSTTGRDNNYYVVACDVSIYSDYAEHSFAHYGNNTNDYDSTTDDADGSSYWDEPTLAGRTLFYIIGVDGASDEGASSTPSAAPEGLPESMRTMWKLNDSSYQGGTNDGSEKYLEEYEITYPARRTSNKTLELVTLSKDASNYIIPGVNDTSTEFDVKFAETGSQFAIGQIYIEDDNWSSAHNPLTGARRVIPFYKSGLTKSSDPWSVTDGTTATILVTKTVSGTTYNIARYKLTFRDSATPLTQTQLALFESGTDDDTVGGTSYWWQNMTYRSHTFMEHNYQRVAQLTFDYGLSSDASTLLSDGAQKGFHLFPMDWENTSYAFYDGRINTGTYNDSGDKNNEGTYWVANNDSYTWYDTDNTERDIYTQWCMYSIVNDYFGYGDSSTTVNGEGNKVRPRDTTTDKAAGTDDYWLYIDASDRPGSVAEITFDEQLCTGSQIFGTALIKSAAESSSDDAGVMLTIMGITDNGDGTETHVPIYRQCSSQIRTTTYLNTYDSTYDVDETNLNHSVTGKGSGTNEWFQIYFSFMNTQQEVDYDSYALKIDNYCNSTSGGDYYLDEVYLYILNPTFIVEQIDPLCTADESSAAAVRLMVDFDMLEARLGDNDTEETTDAVSFMIIRDDTYTAALSESTTVDNEAIAKAIGTAQVPFVYTTTDTTTGTEKQQEVNYITLNFYTDYDNTSNTSYDIDKAGTNTADYTGTGYFYTYEVDGTRYLAIDCYADLTPYTPYKILLLHGSDTELSEETYSTAFAACLNNYCEIASDFYLSSTTILKVNGEAVDPTVDYCSGQTVIVQPEVTYADTNGETVVLHDAYYDWFFGTEEEYTSNSTIIGDNTYDVSLQDALTTFRYFFPTATELTEDMKGKKDETANIEFTSDMYTIIDHYINTLYTYSAGTTKSYHGQLVLYKQSLDVTLPHDDYLSIIVQPIEQVVYVYDEEGNKVPATDDDGDAATDDDEYLVYAVCWGYVPLTLSLGGDAPTLNAGFHDVEYPAEDYVPNIRLGKQHITASAKVPITVNLRGAEYATTTTDDDRTVDHLGLLNSDEDIDGLYLLATDDPYYSDVLSGLYFSYYDLPIGKINSLYAEAGNDKESFMTITFDSDNYPLTEGYYYTVLVNCEEKDDNGEAIGSACQGELPITFKVVPEYVVWNGTETDNWNNDDHWTRADYSDLAGTDNSSTNNPYADYTTNEANTTSNGFVPMLFTNVVIPQGGDVELYPAYFAAPSSEETKKEWTGDEASESVYSDETMDLSEHPTENIIYDMMVYGGELDLMGKQLSARKKVGLYDNTSYDIQSMQTQPYRTNVCNEIHLSSGAQILHSELLLCNRVWTDVALPQNQWTLVASPLTDIVAGDWYTTSATGSQATLPLFTDITFDADVNDRYNPAVYQRSWQTAGTIIANSSDDNRSVPAYESTGWTSVYNDASVSYQPGEGYSIKGGYGTESNDSLVFRFPKADEDYTYGSLENNTAKHDQGQLAIFSMVDRSSADSDYNGYSSGSFSQDLSQETTTNGYYIIGNPFTAYMSMKEFMEKNTQFDAYWLPEDGSTGGPVAGNSSDNSSWHMTSDGYDNVYVKPYSAFFVQVDNTSTVDYPYTVTFTPEMQTLSIADEPTLLQFAIKASSPNGTSSASIAYSDNAANDYALGEDVLLLTDNSWNHSQPMVYSVAGSNAVAVNMVADLYQIPIGVFATDDSEYTLTFVGIDKLDTPSLYDADELTDTPLTEGFTLTLNGSTHGRYFLRSAGAPEGISDITAADDEVTIYSPTPHTLVVTATSEITSIEVYSLNGTILAKATPASLSCTLSALPTGVTLVRTTTTNTTTTKKLYVR